MEATIHPCKKLLGENAHQISGKMKYFSCILGTVRYGCTCDNKIKKDWRYFAQAAPFILLIPTLYLFSLYTLVCTNNIQSDMSRPNWGPREREW